MTTKWLADDLFDVSSANISRYKRNYLRQAVCELRFPTLMSLGGRIPPTAFANALRRDYPYTEQGTEFTVGAAEQSGSSYFHVFKSSKMAWSATLKSNALVLETTRYTEYADLRARVLKLVTAAREVIDSDFFTRVGLRYINVVATGDGPLEPWINNKLIGALCGESFKGVSEHAGKLLLAAEDGGCLLQHGLQHKPDQAQKKSIPDYVIDIDAFRNEITIDDVGLALDAVHRQGFAMFDWALGDKAREFLAAEK